MSEENKGYWEHPRRSKDTRSPNFLNTCRKDIAWERLSLENGWVPSYLWGDSRRRPAVENNLVEECRLSHRNSQALFAD